MTGEPYGVSAFSNALGTPSLRHGVRAHTFFSTPVRNEGVNMEEEDKSTWVLLYGAVAFSGFLSGLLFGWIIWG